MTEIFPCKAFLSCVAIKCLSKCPYFKKPPMPWKVLGYEPGLGGTKILLDHVQKEKNPKKTDMTDENNDLINPK